MTHLSAAVTGLIGSHQEPKRTILHLVPRTVTDSLPLCQNASLLSLNGLPDSADTLFCAVLLLLLNPVLLEVKLRPWVLRGKH